MCCVTEGEQLRRSVPGPLLVLQHGEERGILNFQRLSLFFSTYGSSADDSEEQRRGECVQTFEAKS